LTPFSEAFLIKWFKKNPNLTRDQLLVELFDSDVKPGETDPVLQALGGEKWLNDRRHTQKSDHRISQMCRVCSKRAPEVKLFQCGEVIPACSKLPCSYPLSAMPSHLLLVQFIF
jgi:hypothetical protein